MELEDIQATWAQMSDQLEKQKRLTNDIIMKMAQQEYKNRFDKILGYETLGALVTYVAAALILFKFKELDTLPLQICGVLTLIIMVVLPFYSLKYLRELKNTDLADKNYKETITVFTKRKQRYNRLLKLSVYLGFVLMLFIIPVTNKLFNGKDVFAAPIEKFWLWFVPIGFVLYYFFTKRILGCYTANIKKAEQVLKDTA
ncbi:MAG: hypothetical protein E4H26_04580 [Flavobacteriales bacterium]|nr:MAG: hypothetical protein E4H26_04580 [Flavobacteriales bacterium]